ncbi:MAG TPA: SGNH/GDSL hydrolase family protein [Vicinamibacterales bacterium]|nr:SGNH/GDSL hydrolase family protein [Vicinamibacterales bacterium]
MSDRAKTILFALVLGATTFLLGEIALRSVQYVVSGVPPLSLLPGYRERRFPLSPFLVFGPRIDWQIPGKPNPDTAYFNRQGFRTREEIGPKPAGETRIIALGGSTTEEIWNEDGLHWPLWTERTLGKNARPVRVYNSGMSAYTTAHTLVRLAFDVLDYAPDIVLVMHNINDLTVNYRAAVAGREVDGHYQAVFSDKAFTSDLEERDIVLSRLWRGVSARLKGRPADIVVPADYDISRGLEFFRRNLRSIQALASARGVRLVLLTMPVCNSSDVYATVLGTGHRGLSPPLPESFDRFLREFEIYNQAIRDVGHELDVPVMDMNRLMGGDARWFADVVHYNAAGSQRFGELLATELLSGNLLDRQGFDEGRLPQAAGKADGSQR